MPMIKYKTADAGNKYRTVKNGRIKYDNARPTIAVPQTKINPEIIQYVSLSNSIFFSEVNLKAIRLFDFFLFKILTLKILA